jgi:hypothetical protein
LMLTCHDERVASLTPRPSLNIVKLQPWTPV